MVEYQTKRGHQSIIGQIFQKLHEREKKIGPRRGHLFLRPLKLPMDNYTHSVALSYRNTMGSKTFWIHPVIKSHTEYCPYTERIGTWPHAWSKASNYLLFTLVSQYNKMNSTVNGAEYIKVFMQR